MTDRADSQDGAAALANPRESIRLGLLLEMAEQETSKGTTMMNVATVGEADVSSRMDKEEMDTDEERSKSESEDEEMESDTDCDELVFDAKDDATDDEDAGWRPEIEQDLDEEWRDYVLFAEEVKVFGQLQSLKWALLDKAFVCGELPKDTIFHIFYKRKRQTLLGRTKEEWTGSLEVPSKCKRSMSSFVSECLESNPLEGKFGTLDESSVVTDFRVEDYGILQALPVNVRAKLRKVTVQKPGDYIKRLSSPWDDGSSCLGMLVVVLPTSFEGGAIKFRRKKASCYQSTTPHWFITTKGVHEVDAVTAGVRIALVYSLEEATFCNTKVQPVGVINKLRELVSDPFFLKDGCLLAYSCENDYQSRPEGGLRDRDLMLYAAAEQVGLAPEVKVNSSGVSFINKCFDAGLPWPPVEPDEHSKLVWMFDSSESSDVVILLQVPPWDSDERRNMIQREA